MSDQTLHLMRDERRQLLAENMKRIAEDIGDEAGGPVIFARQEVPRGFANAENGESAGVIIRFVRGYDLKTHMMLAGIDVWCIPFDSVRVLSGQAPYDLVPACEP